MSAGPAGEIRLPKAGEIWKDPVFRQYLTIMVDTEDKNSQVYAINRHGSVCKMKAEKFTNTHQIMWDAKNPKHGEVWRSKTGSEIAAIHYVKALIVHYSIIGDPQKRCAFASDFRDGWHKVFGAAPRNSKG